VSNPVLDAIRSRRIARSLTERPVERAVLEQVLEAARWSPNAGNRRLQRFVAIDDPLALRLVRMVAPGMFQRPTAAILVCIDRDRVASFGMRTSVKGLSVDVGTAAQTMLLAAHSLGLGSGIVTSFSQAAVSAVLNLPAHLSPELLVCLGYAAPAQPPAMRARTPVTWQSLTDWAPYPGPRGAREDPGEPQR
jgi:nitroreductase